VAPFPLLPILAGCATATHRQVLFTAATVRQTVADWKACAQAVRSKPEYAPLLPHLPDPDTGQPTMAQ
jgi:hypothetical protein